MKKSIKILILFLILIICQNAFCYTLQNSELNKIIYNKIDSEIKKELGDVEYKINIQNSVSGNIITNDLNAPNIEISSSSAFNPISYRRVTVKDLKGNIVKTIPISVKVLIYKDVLVTSEAIPYGTVIDETNTRIEKKEVSKFYNKVLTGIPENSIASRNILKGTIIQKNLLKQKSIIEKNQYVDIVFEGHGVQITLKGKALNEGALGDKILVRSDKYNKIYSATVDSASKVTVRI